MQKTNTGVLHFVQDDGFSLVRSVGFAEVDDGLEFGVEELLRLLDHWMLEGTGLDRAGAGGAGFFCDGGCDGGEQSELEDSGVTQGCACDLFGVGVDDDGEHGLGEGGLDAGFAAGEGPCGVGEGFGGGGLAGGGEGFDDGVLDHGGGVGVEGGGTGCGLLGCVRSEGDASEAVVSKTGVGSATSGCRSMRSSTREGAVSGMDSGRSTAAGVGIGRVSSAGRDTGADISGRRRRLFCWKGEKAGAEAVFPPMPG